MREDIFAVYIMANARPTLYEDIVGKIPDKPE
jgi:hypothetical protein